MSVSGDENEEEVSDTITAGETISQLMNESFSDKSVREIKRITAVLLSAEKLTLKPITDRRLHEK